MSLGFDAVSQNGVSGAPHQATNFALSLIGTTGPALVFDYHAGDSTASGYTFARALAAYETGSGGTLALIATGTLRDGHYVGDVRTTLIEPSRSNWLLDSADLTTVNWTAGSSGGPAAPTPTAGQTTDPAGTASAASKIVQPAVSIGGAYSVLSQNPSGQGAVVKAFSVWLKGALGDELFYVNATPDGSTYTRVLAALTTAWAQYSVLTGTSNSIYAQLGTDRRDASEVATTANTLYAWCPQLEDGGYATSPIVNTSSARTRPADVLTYTVPGGSGQVGTLYEKYFDLATQAWVEQVSALTTSTTFVPTSGRAWVRWCFALGTQTLATLRDLTTVSHLMTGALTSGKNIVGTTYTKSLTGGATPSGVLARKALKSYAGGLTPTAALARKAAKLLAGGATPTGALARKALRFLSGGMTPSGALTTLRARVQSLTGGMTPSGALARKAAKAFTAGLTPSGTVLKKVAKVLAGVITPSGIASTFHGVIVSLSGALTPTGALARKTARGLAAGITPAASLVRRTAKAFAGSFAGAALWMDTVARADSTTSPGTPDTGNTYVVWNGGLWGVSSGKLYNPSADSDGALVVDLGTQTQDVTVDHSTTNFSHSDGIVLRGTDATNFIAVSHDASTVYLLLETASLTHSVTSIGSFTFASGTTYTLRATVSGNLITAYANGTQVGTYTLTGGEITRYVGTYAGLWSNNDSTARFSNMTSGALPGLSGTLAAFKLKALSLAGAIAPTGALARAMAKALTAGMTPVGTFARNLARQLSGALAFAGAESGGFTSGSTYANYYGYDTTTRADSATSLGTADKGGSWTSTGTAAWGISSNGGYNTQTTGGAQSAYLDVGGVSQEVGLTFITDAIQNHVITVMPRYVDTSNFLQINTYAGAVKIVTKVAGVSNVRVTVAQGAAGNPLPATGASTTDVMAQVSDGNLVQVYINGVAVPGASYQLSGGEITAFGSATKVGVYNSWVSGSVTASRFTNFYAKRAVWLAGTLTMTGMLLKSLARTLTGSLAPGGAVSRSNTFARVLSGVLTPTGALARKAGRSLTGALTSSGVVVKNVAKKLAGAMTPTGALVRKVVRVLAGTLTTAGTLARKSAKKLAGSLTPSGVVTYGNQYARTLAGALTPSGIVTTVRSVLRALAGALTPTGTLARRVSKAFGGSLPLSGALVKRTFRSLAGVLTPTATLSAMSTYARALGGAVAPTGSLQRQLARSLFGALTFAGSLVVKVAGSARRGIMLLYRAVR
ncbi:MAG: hypothetical protein ABI119_06010 [Gemmatimonadaceae bacterium]